MKRYIRQIAILFSAALLIIGFQNCTAKVQPKDLIPGEDLIAERAGADDSTTTTTESGELEMTTETTVVTTTETLPGRDPESAENIEVETATTTTVDMQILAECLNRPQKYKRVAAANSGIYENLTGSGLIESNAVISAIQNYSGNFLIKAKTTRAQVQRMSNGNGKVYICNVDVDKFSDFEGDLYLVHSRVKSMEHVRGSIHLIESAIDSKVDVTENIK